MTQPSCPRVWEAEAIEDGRLVSEERLSFEKHVSACRECAQEVAALARLKETMQHLPALESTPFERVRSHALLLRHANARVVGASGARPVRWLAVAATVFAVAALLVGTWWFSSGAAIETNPAETAAALPRFEVTPSGVADWTDRSEGKTARVVLKQGKTLVHVHPLASGQRFLLSLPDGEIEVRGTRFSAEVVGQRTRRVEVTEGMVALRLKGLPEQLLRAGDRWALPAPASASAPPLGATAGDQATTVACDTAGGKPVPTLSRASQSLAAPENGPAIASAQERDPGPQRLPQGSASFATLDAADSASARFAEAVAAYHSGRYNEAEGRFARFMLDFPRDARGEDAAFLRAVARARAGDASGAARLAREYLQRFPHGLRRHEAERLLGDRSQSEQRDGGLGGDQP